MKSRFSASFFSLLLLLSLVVAPSAQHIVAQTAVASTEAYSKALAEIEAKTESRRNALGIPGMSLVIVKDGKVIYMKGLGYRDFDRKIAVTPDTQFPIGSATKAFTALSVLISADQGKLSLDDSPKKVLPFFKMYDPDADKGITIRDLLSHSSGLNRTDLAMVTGKLNRAELIQVAAQAKPGAKFREKFLYQNIMFTAAGEIVSQVQKEEWEKWVPKNIFKPLGMTNSSMLIAEMLKAKDHSLGYDYNFDTKATRLLPFREIKEVAPAGSINSSARDMAEWLKFALSGGVANGKRIVSEKGFEEWLKPQMKRDAAGKSSYGLGWFIDTWNGKKVVQHGGNIDGFNSLVAMIPEEKLGFVMLTNVTGSPLGQELMPIIFGSLTAKPAESTVPVPAEKEAGTYRIEAAGIDIGVTWADGKLTMNVPGQPAYTLERVSGRKYKLAGAPDGFFITFGDNTAYLEQPQGNVTMPRVVGGKVVAKPSEASTAARELLGEYVGPRGGKVAIKQEADGKITFNLSGQMPYTLIDKSKDVYSMSPLPDAYFMTAKRDASGKQISVVVSQPEGEFEFKREDKSAKPTIAIDDLQAKAIAAAGGEANWRKINSRITESTIDMESQGVQGRSISWSKAPNKAASETKLLALGKEIGSSWEYFDGTGGGQALTFMSGDNYSGTALNDARNLADFYSMLDWQAKYKKVEVVGTSEVGGEDAYIVSFEPKAGSTFTEFYSTTTFLLLRREGINVSSTGGPSLPYTITFSDYREIDGIKLPYKTVSYNIGMGNIISVVKSVKHNASIDDQIFVPKKLYGDK